MQLPVQVRWKSKQGNYRQTRGKTGNISGNGMFMMVPVRVPRATPLTITVALPAEVTRTPVELYCQGRVVRLNKPGDYLGIGAIIDDYQFRPVRSQA